MRSMISTILFPSVLVIAGFWLAYQFVEPAPPKQVVLTTGSNQGAYFRFAEQYREFLAKHGIEVVIKESHGSIENLERLRNGQADIGLVQGGTVDKNDMPEDLLSLGSLYYEPLWLFHRQDKPINTLTDLRGKNLSIGQSGSGSRALAKQLLKDNGLIENKNISLTNIENGNLVKALETGKIDAAMMVASPESKLVRTLLKNESVDLFSFERAEAYHRRMKFLSFVSLPQGMVDLEQNIPSNDRLLLAPTANLIINQNLHPALQDLFLQAAEEVHGNGGWFEEAAEFPNQLNSELPISPEAKRFYKFGPPFLQRFLPFWAASLIDRLKVMLLPLIVLMIPLMKVMPPIYTWRMRSRIYRWYQELEQIDLSSDKNNFDRDELLKKLHTIEQEVIHVQVPLSFASQLYDLRQHIELVKRRLG